MLAVDRRASSLAPAPSPGPATTTAAPRLSGGSGTLPTDPGHWQLQGSGSDLDGASLATALLLLRNDPSILLAVSKQAGRQLQSSNVEASPTSPTRGVTEDRPRQYCLPFSAASSLRRQTELQFPDNDRGMFIRRRLPSSGVPVP